MSLTLEVGFPRYFCGNKDMVENSCWVNNSSWIKAHKSNFTFIAYVLEFNKSIGKTIAKKRNDALSRWTFETNCNQHVYLFEMVFN